MSHNSGTFKGLTLMGGLLFLYVVLAAMPAYIMDHLRDDNQVTRVDSVHTFERTIERVPGPRVEVPLEVEKPFLVRDTVVEYVEVMTQVPVRVEVPINHYTNTYTDSSLTATMEAEVAGDLLAWDFSYTPFITRVTETETLVVERDNIIIQQEKPGRLSIGASTLLYNPLRRFEPGVSVGPFVGYRFGDHTRVDYSPQIPLLGGEVVHTVDIKVGLNP